MAKKVRKTYQTMYNILQLQHWFKLKNGRKVLVEFLGGGFKPRKTHGRFATDNPELIEAMESSGDYNKQFKLYSEVEVEDVSDVIDQSNVVKLGAPELKEVGGITTVQAAREFLVKNFTEVTYSMVPNKLAVLKEAEKLGLVFLDLPRE